MSAPRIFVSYRRDDSSANAGRLFDWLARQFGRERIFLDTDKIASGADFPRVLEERLAASDVLLAVIGPQWLTIADAAGRRLDQPDDYVRREIATALAGETRVIPVLVGRARMPPADSLPDALRALATRNAARLEDASFERDFDVLVDDILERPRGFMHRELDRLQRLAYVATRSLFVAPVVVTVVVLAVWMKALDAVGLDTQINSYLLWAANLVSGPAPESPVLLVTIDAASERELGRAYESATLNVWRHDHARLIDRAASAGAAAVVFDLSFESDLPANTELAQAALRASGAARPMRTVFGVRTIENGEPRLASGLRQAGAWGSLCIVRRLGYAFMAPLAVLRWRDPDRRPAIDVVPADTPALALVATQAQLPQSVDVSRRQIGFAGIPLLEPVRYSALERIRWGQGQCGTLAIGDEVAMLVIALARPGYWREPARRVSYAEVLEPGRVPDQRLRDRIVLVGVTQLGREKSNSDVHDVVRGLTHYVVYGVELQADAIANLASGRVIETPTVDFQAFVMVVMAIGGAAASFFTATRARGWRRGVLAVAVAVYVLIAVASAASGLLLNLLYDLAAFFAAYSLLRRLQARALRTPADQAAA